MIDNLMKIGLSLILSMLIGCEREVQDKNAGLRTIMLITLGAVLIVIVTLSLEQFTNDFDAIRGISYYLVALGFIGGGIITRQQGKTEGITTAALLLPMALVGILCGLGEYILAIVISFVIFIILKLKYLEVKLKWKKQKKVTNESQKKKN